MTYIIKNWDKYFENAQSRKVEFCHWVAMPNKHDGLSYRRLAMMKNGPEIFAGWVIIVQIASKMRNRGVLENDKGPLTADDISVMSSFPLKTIELALSTCCKPPISWILDDSQSDTGDYNPNIPEGRNRTEGTEGTEQKEPHTPPIVSSPPPLDPAHTKCANYLSERILERKQQKITESTIDKWADCVRLMVVRDNRTLHDVGVLLKECHDMPPDSKTGFTWAENIHSMEKFREQWNAGKIWIGMTKKVLTREEKDAARLKELEEINGKGGG